MGGIEDFVGEGGLQRAERPVGDTLTMLDEAMALFASMSDPDARGEVIRRAETMLEDMKASGDWRPPDF
jgi:hypothetical protein